MSTAAKQRTEKQPPSYITSSSGRKTAVVLPIKDYNALLEDLHDLAVVAERRDEELIPFEEVKTRLIRDGRL